MASYAAPATAADDDDTAVWLHNTLLEYLGTRGATAPLIFHLFPLLAPELRLKIWKYALEEPETIHLTWNSKPTKFRYSLRRKVPPVLQVCKETREWFIQKLWMREAPKETYQIVRLREGQDDGVYLDWSKDRVHIYRGCTLNKHELYSLRHLRYLSMNWGLRTCWVHERSLSEGVGFIRNFQHLDTLTLVVTVRADGFEEKQIKRSLRVIAAVVLKAFALEHISDNSWQGPKLRVLGTCGARALQILERECSVGFPLL